MAVMFCTSAAQATVVTFDLLPHFDPLPLGGTISTQGFDFTLSGDGNGLTVTGNDCAPNCPDNGTQGLVIFNAFSQATVTMRDSGGATFSLNQFDAAESHANLPNFWTDQIFVVGNLFGGGTVDATFQMDLIHDGPGGQADYQSFVLPTTFLNLTSATFTGLINPGNIRHDFTLDNIHVNEAFGSVPEPTTLLLLGLGLAGLGFARKRLH